jgi:hypothetical protein
MPNIADFVVIQDHAITIPHDGIDDFHVDPFVFRRWTAPGSVDT